jgi:hypothetical protein
MEVGELRTRCGQGIEVRSIERVIHRTTIKEDATIGRVVDA